MNRVDAPIYDAVLFVSFGGPDRHEDVIPFLENVVRGKPVPRERLLEVAEHYYRFGGKSPINEQNRALIAAVRAQLAERGSDLPVYWGNRNWHPLLPDALLRMSRDGVNRAIAFVTSAFSSYSGCRQYRENIENARRSLGRNAPVVDKIRPFFNHPGFLEAMADRVREALSSFDEGERPGTKILYTAHSIPSAMADGCRYVEQLREASALVSARVGAADGGLVFQSRSGPPSQPWLGPDVCDRIRELRGCAVTHVCVAPIGFLSDHLEVLLDLDVESKETAEGIGLEFQRAGTVGTHSSFVSCVCDLIEERLNGGPGRESVGALPPLPDACPADCCPPPARRAGPQPAAAPPGRRAAAKSDAMRRD